MIKIVNLTPHPVTIVRDGREPVTFPACAAADLPRATEGPTEQLLMLGESGDGQAGYANSTSLDRTGLVDERSGYIGVEGLPTPEDGELAFGCETFRIVSIVTAIGALAGGRTIVDLLIPMGQVRDAQGRVIGATSLAPAATLLSPMAQRILDSTAATRAAANQAHAAIREALTALDRAAHPQVEGSHSAAAVAKQIRDRMGWAPGVGAHIADASTT